MTEQERKKSAIISQMNKISVKKKRLKDLDKSYNIKRDGKVIAQMDNKKGI